jgi:hypothetical protein
MTKWLNAYLWGYKNWEAAEHSFRKFREFYPDGDIYIKVDDNGDFENYKKVAEKYDAECSKNPFQIGYPGNHQQHNVGRECWPMDNALLWCDNIYWACKKSDSKFMIILEEDSFILKPISIIKGSEFGIAGFEYNTNVIPEVLLDVIKQIGGNTNIPTNLFGNKGYGAGGGFIIDCKKWITSWEKFRPVLELNYDMIASQNKLIGWSDCLAQLVIMAGGYEVIQNPQMVQTWYHERPDLYPNYTDWRDYEIADYVKDIEIIKQL